MNRPDSQQTLALIAQVALKNGVFSFDLPDEMQLSLAQLMVEAGVVADFFHPSMKCALKPCVSIAEERVVFEGDRNVFYINFVDPKAAIRLEAAFSTLEDELGINPGEAEFDLPPPDNANKVKLKDRIPYPKTPKGDRGNNGFGPHGRRGIHEITSPPDESKTKKHTQGDLRFYRKMKKAWQDNPEANPEWEWRRELMLSETIMEKLKPGDWFRNMCVLNGLSTTALEEITDIKQTTWGNYYRGKGIRPFLIFMLMHTDLPQGFERQGREINVLPGTLWGLPTENGKVDLEIEQKILRKFSFIHPTLILAGAEVLANGYKEGTIARSEVEGVFKDSVPQAAGKFSQ